MRKLIVTWTLSIMLLLFAGAARAATVLTSQPLKTGAGGLVCACSNLTSSVAAMELAVRSPGGVTSACGGTVLPGFPISCTFPSTAVRTCTVSRTDGGPLSAKQFLCTLSSLDAAGNPTAVVPVDKKMKQ